MTVLHICPLDKFLPPFIEFVRKHIGTEDQLFFTYRSMKKYPYAPGPDAMHRDGKFSRYFSMFYQMYKSERVILHGLFDKFVIAGLFFQPWLLKKCFWLVWGADLYRQDLDGTSPWAPKVFFRRFVIRNMGHIVTSIDGDYENAKAWYKPKGRRLAVYTYPSSLYTPAVGTPKNDGVIRILLGNSADPSNNHIEAFEHLKKYAQENIEIYSPLSYGVPQYRDEVCRVGKELFGDKFKPIVDFIQYDKYIELLSTIDIAVFNHDRQQAMSNTRMLLGMGKKVYMKSGTSSFQLFEKLDVKVFTLDEFSLDPQFPESARNEQTIQRVYSPEALKSNLIELFSCPVS
ncbi:TDP-N-acetylfucosamine:lipid II N-acetylfucosaminyltransferase [Ferrimonas balearica]|uniref:TDP-N-acetylfucosamine:lipid II N-acetylfucosaminyltransferase n=1 Tax=Ferrimonas balearica TaxID=44012 RepID=UPI001C958851|nr:TDP-N-acetylfucosamine:lipid II N-acetylfucosaminyltransferase [Ferrimonas balearica]MBY5978947.1 TDP-N-acetylfucosamine:lipid II N-acetylfucosaminyltransferase [Ferrimonas balearica]